MWCSLSPKDTSLIRTELFGKRGVLIRGGLLYFLLLIYILVIISDMMQQVDEVPGLELVIPSTPPAHNVEGPFSTDHEYVHQKDSGSKSKANQIMQIEIDIPLCPSSCPNTVSMTCRAVTYYNVMEGAYRCPCCAGLETCSGVKLDSTPANKTHSHGVCRAVKFIDLVTSPMHSELQFSILSFGEDGFYQSRNESRKIVCNPRNVTEGEPIAVQLMNSTELLSRLGNRNDTHQTCAVVLFYAPWCVFCSRVAPHYNALARAFPQLDVLAIDAVHFSR